jgi:AraC-like DNA-binding protein
MLTAALDRALERRAIQGTPGTTVSSAIASGEGWSVHDVLCTSGPEDRPFEERHSRFGIAMVVAGSFAYRSAAGRELLAPGALLLGNAGQCFECGHQHGRGDRCIAFQYAPETFERVAAEAGAAAPDRRFRSPRLPPVRPLAALVARAGAGIAGAAEPDWEELAFDLAGRAVELATGLPPGGTPAPRGAEARIAAAVRHIEREPDADHGLDRLAGAANLSRFHFLRIFERVTGVTPHQFVLRTRLRAAALRLVAGRERVLDIALDSGFGDLSNFNRTFRAEFGSPPSAQREAGGTISRSRA